MSEVVSCQSSVVSGEAADRLTDARCPRCGYSLRGLPENRCPECGILFDPDAFVASFLPKWPILLKWFTLAQAIGISCATVRPAAALIQLAGSGFASQIPQVFIWSQISIVVLTAGTGVLALATTIGLHYWRDWARRAFVAMLLLQNTGWFVPLIFVWSWQHHLPLGVRADWATLPLIAALVCSILPAVIMILWVSTGLRRHSLNRSPSSAPVPLDSRHYRKRGDWLLLMVLLITCIGLLSVGLVTNAISTALRSGTSSASGSRVIWSLLKGVIGVATAIWAFYSAVRIWRNPSVLRQLLLILAGLAWAVILVEFCVQQASPSRVTVSVLKYPLMDVLLDSLAWLLPPMFLLVYSRFRVTPEDVRDLPGIDNELTRVQTEAGNSGTHA